MTIREITEAITKNYNNYNVFGIRSCDDDLNVGDELANSYDQRDDVYDDHIELNGTCATSFGSMWLSDDVDYYDEHDYKCIERALEIQRGYDCYKHQYIIAGDSSEYGDDEDEIIIRNAVVIAKIK